MTINKDQRPPTLTVSTLANGARTNNANLNVSGTVSDAGGIRSVTVNGQAAPIIGNVFSSLVVLVSGNNTITVTAQDLAGNQNVNRRTIILDQVAPQVTLASPADNMATAQSNITVSGSVNEAASVVISDQLQNQYATALSGSTFSQTLPLASGLNTLTVTALDLAGNKGSAARTVLQDSVKPTLTVTTPSADTVIRQDTTIIAGTVTDALTDVTVEIETDTQRHQPAVDTAGRFSQNLTLPAEALYPVLVTATDEAGNNVSTIRNIFYTRGIVTINAGGEYTQTTNINVNVSYHPDFVGYRLSNDNVTWGKWNDLKTVSTQTTVPHKLMKGDGTKTVYAQFRRGDGEESAVYFYKIILDSTRPEGTILINNGVAVTNDPALTLTLNVSGATEMQFSADGKNWSAWQAYAPTATYTLPTTLQTDGKKKIQAQFRDAAGNVSKKVKGKISLDRTAPTGTILINKGDDATPSPIVTVSLKAKAATQMQLLVEGDADWSAWETYEKTKTVTLASGTGTRTVQARFRDAAGNVSAAVSDAITLQ